MNTLSPSSLAWIFLAVAGLLEVAWVIAMKFSDGFSKLPHTALVLLLSGGSLFCLSRAIIQIPIGTAYSVWTGIGAVGALVAGIIFFGESMSLSRAVFVAFVLVGVAGLKVTATSAV